MQNSTGTKDILVYKKTSGINFAQRPEELEWTGDGTCELVDTENVYIDRTGTISRAAGYTYGHTFEGTPHTLHNRFVGVGTNLYEITDDGQKVLRKSNCSGDPICVTMYGGHAYCCDGNSTFIVREATVVAWEFTLKYGAKSTKLFAGPIPHDNSFTAYGRVFIIVDGIIFYSEPIGPTMFNYAENVIWDTDGIVEADGVNGMLVIGTRRGAFTLSGEDFNSVKKTVISDKPIVANTIAFGVYKKEKVVCFTLPNGMYIAANGLEPTRISENRIPHDFFEGKSFVGSTLINERYTIYSATEAYTIDLETKAIERHTVTFDKVSDGLACEGNVLYNLEIGTLTGATQSKVQFQALHFNIVNVKSIRRILVRGYFEKAHTWTITGDDGQSHSVTSSGSGSVSKIAHEYILNGTYKVRGQCISLSLETDGNFSINEIKVLPILSTARRRISAASSVVATTNVQSPQALGTTVTVTARGAGGSGRYQYRFWINSGAGYAIVQDYSSDNTYTWTPTVRRPYDMLIDVRNIGSQEVREASTNIFFYEIV